MTTKGRKHFGEAIIETVLVMKAEGKSNREISEHFCLPNVRVLEQLLNRYNRKQRKIAAGIIPRKKGRPRKNELLDENKDNTIKLLRMENELLRSFLSEAGRR